MKFFLSISFLLIGFLLLGQELPPIETFTTSDYNAENQNWMISQDSNNFIYVANNSGLLEFNGAQWETYPSPNNTILRAVKVIDDVIYTGAYEEFGFWKRNDIGRLEYKSLIQKLDNKGFNDDQIWNIISYDEWVLFQSAHRLFFYNPKSQIFKTIDSKNIIYKVFNVENRIYYHIANEGVYVLEDGKPKLVTSDGITLSDRVINMFQANDKLVLLFRNSGFFYLADARLQSWDVPSNQKLKALNIFSSSKLKNGNIAIGTISKGLVIVSRSGDIIYQINQSKGLANNTVLSLFEDNENNVWAGLDNGINCINVNAPIKTFIDYNGILGTVYTTLIFQNKLYIGTNQGLFYRSLDSNEAEFVFVEGTAGQVWSLFSNNDEDLFCGHHLGTFLIKNDSAENIISILGAWNFRAIPNHENLLLQGNYDGLYILEKKNSLWQIRNKIKGFKNSSRFFEINDSNQILVDHEYKGVYNIQMDDELQNMIEVSLNNELEVGKNSSLVKYKDDIWFASSDGLFKYSKKRMIFVKDTLLSRLISSQGLSKIVASNKDKLWVFSKENISFLENDNLTNQPKLINIPIPLNQRKGVNGFENIQHIDNKEYVLGTSNGYLTMDLGQLDEDVNYKIYLNSAQITSPNDSINYVDLDKKGLFKYKYGNLTVNVSVPEYDKFRDVKYQYILNGHINRWSGFQKSSKIDFENLSYGDYNLEVRAKVGNQFSDNTISYAFQIEKPWYLSDLAVIVYILMLFILGMLIHKAYKFYFRRILKHEQIKNEKLIVQVQNDKLNQDIDSKNRELATSTMSIIKKNELLRKIKKQLKPSLEMDGVKSAIQLIDTNLKNNKDWNFFKEAFNNADKDFLDKIKIAHPDLTPNDLKFCAYLRLNLSSKEIAPLLNISTKSVETKRYRLRKRLRLSHDESLVNYILKF